MWINALQLHKHHQQCFLKKKKGNKEEQTARTTKSLWKSGARVAGGWRGAALGTALSTSHHLFWDTDRSHELLRERGKPARRVSTASKRPLGQSGVAKGHRREQDPQLADPRPASSGSSAICSCFQAGECGAGKPSASWDSRPTGLLNNSFTSHSSLITVFSRHKHLCCLPSPFPKGL